MITAVCIDCQLALRTICEPSEGTILMEAANEETAICPKCSGPVEFYPSISDVAFNSMDIHDLNYKEMYAALHGLGLPEERECSPSAVRELFKKSIKSVDVTHLKGSHRSLINSIEFVDGTTLYIGASPFGAIIYRIA